jgi:hypothetical protein
MLCLRRIGYVERATRARIPWFALPFALVIVTSTAVSSAQLPPPQPQPQRGNDASDPDDFVQPWRAATARTYIDLRGGMATTNPAGVVDVCMEGTPLKFLTLETCGTGAGLWRGNQGTQMAHLRTELQPYRFTFQGVAFDPQIGIGIAELQIGPDDPGLRFGSAKGKFDTTGPESTLSLQAKVPFRYDLELVAELNTGLVYLPHAPELARPQSTILPFAAFSLGMGF